MKTRGVCSTTPAVFFFKLLIHFHALRVQYYYTIVALICLRVLMTDFSLSLRNRRAYYNILPI